MTHGDPLRPPVGPIGSSPPAPPLPGSPPPAAAHFTHSAPAEQPAAPPPLPLPMPLHVAAPPPPLPVPSAAPLPAPTASTPSPLTPMLVPPITSPSQVQPVAATPANHVAGDVVMTMPDFRAADERAEQVAQVHGGEQGEIDEVIQGAPPWLISFVVHLSLLILMALLATSATFTARTPDPPVDLVYGEKLGDQLIDSRFDIPTDNPIGPNETPAFSPSDLPPVDDPIASAPTLDALPSHGGTLIGKDPASPTIGFALKGREQGMKIALLGAYGGNATTESAVKMGLDWLVRQQQASGAWSLKGPYGDATQKGDIDNPIAATAMALLAFQGAGNTHKRGDYSATVAKGWEWLLKQQDAQGNFYHEGMSQGLYAHAIATIGICELTAMTDDAKIRAAAEKAVRYAVSAQDKQGGGWRYIPGTDSDTSVTGWFVMAMQSARMAYITVPPEVFDNIERYLNSAQTDNGSRYSYQPGRDATVPMTAEALLCRQYLGWKRDDPRLRDGVNMLLQRLPTMSDQNVYYWYYATQVMHHMEGDDWRAWNDVTRQMLPENQEKNGKERGSWSPTRDRWGDTAGRLYVTCLSVYMLEVYYRHLPLYSRIYQAPGQSPKTATQ